MYTQVEKSKEHKNRALAKSVTQKKSDVKQGFGFYGNRENNLIRNNKISTHLINESNILQFKTCNYCKYENSHAPWCTPQYRAQIAQQRQEEHKQAADQSMDHRTREDQSHRQHGGDAKGRERMYAKWHK